MPNATNLVWTPEARRVLYTDLRRQFGPWHSWENKSKPADKAAYKIFLADFAKLVGAKSAGAVEHQIEFAIQRGIVLGAFAQSSILNKAVAFECGFLTNADLRRMTKVHYHQGAKSPVDFGRENPYPRTRGSHRLDDRDGRSAGVAPMTDWKSIVDWQPLVKIDDFFDATGHQFHAAMARFRELTKDHARDNTLVLPDGWHDINPRMAEELLKRNTRNRPVDYNFVLAYATHMVNCRWKKTGEPIIINANGDVDDAGHRLWACYFSGATFTTYVVNVEADPDLFAFIDSGRSRNGRDTLTTAGIGPQSPLVARIVKEVAMPFDESSLTYQGRISRSPCTLVDILDYVRANPEMPETVRLIREIYPAAVKGLDNLPVACFIGWKIQTLYGSGVLEDFFGDMVRPDLPPTNAIAVLQRRLADHRNARNYGVSSPKKRAHLKPVQILALTIRAFNSWRAGEFVKRLDPRADDAFPDFDLSEVREAAD